MPSKVVSQRESSMTPAFRSRSVSANRLKNDFYERAKNNQAGDTNGRYYDLREYTISGKRYYPFMFSKTCKHDPITGFPEADDIDKVLSCVVDSTPDSLAAAADSQSDENTRKLVSPHAGLSFTLIGGDPRLVGCKPPLLCTGSKNMFEMCEVYQRCLLRDVAFSNWENDPKVLSAVAALNAFPPEDQTVSYDITPQTLLRGESKGLDGMNTELVGPYVSQMLFAKIDYDNMMFDQKYRNELDQHNQVTHSGYLNVQNGGATNPIVFGRTTYVNNLRCNGSIVHNDALYSFGQRAAITLLKNGISLTPVNDIRADKSKPYPVGNFVSIGPPNLLSTIADAAGICLYTAFNQKWCMNMKIRPEVMASIIGLVQKGTLDKSFPGLEDLENLLNGPAAATISDARAKNQSLDPNNPDYDTYNLDCLYPEGSPVHPTYPAGHATVAGATVTIIKAMMDTTEENSEGVLSERKWSDTGLPPVISSEDGETLESYTKDDSSMMTINGELNKLVSNISLGRDAAGVHYRCDGDCGKKAGEEVAINLLRDITACYYETESGSFLGYTLIKFDGTPVKIANGIVTEL